IFGSALWRYSCRLSGSPLPRSLRKRVFSGPIILERERVRHEPFLNGSGPDAGPSLAIRLDRDRNEPVLLADIAHVELNLPTDLLGDLAFVAGPEVQRVFRRTIVGLGQIEAGQPIRAGDHRV